MPTPDATFHRRLLAATFAAWVAAWLVQWLVNPPLGHDEAAYATEAARILDGLPQLWMYRPVGTNWLAVPGVLAGASERAFRVLPLFLGLGYLASVAWVGRRTLGLGAAAWGIAIITGTYSVTIRAAHILSDLPSIACLLAATGVLAIELDRDDGPRWRLVIVAPLLAAALYIRYGSIATIGVLALASVAVWPRRILARPGPVAATIALLLLLLLPHALHAIDLTGSPLGILTWSSGVPRRAYVGEGLVTYLTANPIVFYGGLTPVALVAGLVSLARPPAARRPHRFLWLAGVGHLVVLGVQTHGTARYAFYGTSLLVLLGADAIMRAWRAWLARRAAPRLGRWAPRLALAAVVVSWLVTLGIVGPGSLVAARPDTWTVATARFLRTQAAGRPCHVIGRHYTQLVWYSGCSVTVLVPDDAIAKQEPTFGVWTFMGGQPNFDTVVAWSSVPTVRVTLLRLPAILHIMRFDPAPPAPSVPAPPAPPAAPAP